VLEKFSTAILSKLCLQCKHYTSQKCKAETTFEEAFDNSFFALKN